MKTRLGLALLLLSLLASPAFAASKYPPGPPYRSCPDTLTNFKTQNPDTIANPCFPAVGDTVLGVRGIFIGADVRASAYAFYFETSGGGQYTGLQAFTGATNYVASVPGTPSGGNLVLGDLVAVYGTMQEFPAVNGTTEIEGPDVVQATNDILVRRISTGNLVPMDIVTTSQLHWIPAFSQGERYEDGLVRIRGPLKVGRTAVGPGLQSGNYLLTRVSPSSDSVLIDNFTMSPTLGGPAPPVGTIVDSVQGIVSQNTATGVNSYRIQLRDANDIFLAVPPNLSDAYPIEDNQIRLVFDRNVDQASAESESNYSLTSEIDGTIIDTAVMPNVPGNVVILTITSVRSDGDLETVGVLGVGSAGCPSCVISPLQQRTFVNGVLSCAAVQAPDASRLPLFDDRSRFAGTGALPGTKLTFRGTVMHAFGTLYYLQDEDGGTRGGVSVFGPSATLVTGRRYRISGQVQEFDRETEIVSTVLITDEGPGSPPTPRFRSIPVLSDTTTDQSQSVLTGEDFEGMRVRIDNAMVTENRTIGQSFFVAGPGPSFPDTILVSNLSGALNSLTPPDSGSIVNVSGLLHHASGTFRICPPSGAEVQEINPPTFVFNQLGFRHDGETLDYSDYGECGLTYTPAATGQFLNVAVRLPGIGNGFWAIRNVHLPDDASAPPIENISVQFPLYPLGVSVNTVVSQLEYSPLLSPEPMNDVDSLKWILGLTWTGPVGLGHPRPSPGGGIAAPAPITAVPESIRVFLPFGPPVVIYRATWIGCTMPNLDLDNAAHPGDLNGCVPAAAANSLRWLDDAHGEFGLPADARSVFTQLSDLMQREFKLGATMDQVIRAKLDFIEAHRLPIHVKFQSVHIGGNRSSTLGGTTATNANPGGGTNPAWPTEAWLMSEGAAGEDIEVFGGYYYVHGGQWVRDGGHMVVLTGAGIRNGVPWLAFKDDSTQTGPGGTRQRITDIVTPHGAMTLPGLGGVFEINGVPRRVTFFIEGVVSESYDANAPLPPAQESFTEYCQWIMRVIPPRGKLRLHFPPGNRCFNVTVYELDRTGSPPNIIKKRVWNFNANSDRVYVNDDTLNCQFILVHNDDNQRNAGVYAPYTAGVDVLPASFVATDSPSNPDAFGGFSFGGADNSSGEFGTPSGPNVTVNGSTGCNLIDLPHRMGAGVQQLTLTHPIPIWNPYWGELELRLEVEAVTTPGSLQITCPSSGFSGSIPIPAPGRYVVDLGTIPLTNQFSITLSTQGGLDFEMDAVGIASQVPASTSVGGSSLPREAGLWSLGPNPSSAAFGARFDLPQASHVKLAVFDVAGREVATLASGTLPPGSYTRHWDGRDASGRRVPAGLYFCRLALDQRIWSVRWVAIR